MKLKTVTKKLSQVRDNIRDKGSISAEDEKILRSLIGDTIQIAQEDLQNLPNRLKNRTMPLAENDNTPLTTEQKFRLRLMEKTGTGSASIH
jgi:polyhydroxyalkanoate synthesis regulator phasin